MQITWFGHAAFRVQCGDVTLLIDPFFSGNPSFVGQDIDAASAGVTHILLTHGHEDHVGDALSIAKDSGAVVVANYELCMWLARQGLENFSPGNTGGTIVFDHFSVTFTQAFHSSAILMKDGLSYALGSPNGLVMHFDNGPTLYHMGDTDIFSDMALIEELHQPDIGLVPVGDRFTMGGAVAALACQRFFRFKTILPCHYGTFASIEPNADKFVAAMEGSKSQVLVPMVGEMLQF